MQVSCYRQDMAQRPTLDFLKTESGAGSILGAMAVLAVILANSPLAADYFSIINMKVPVQLGGFAEVRSVLGWVKDGLMAVFFLVVGMEIKFEILRGELSSPRRLALPLFAALGGMIVPALIYAGINAWAGHTVSGWPVATPTDIAFALAGLAIFAPRLPPALRVFLLTLAIADDLGAVALIAALFSKTIHTAPLVGAGVSLAALAALSRWRRAPYLLYAVGFLTVWAFTLKSGVSTSLAGFACALTVPISARRADRGSALKAFMDALHPYVAYVILPLFALTCAGFSVRATDMKHAFSPITAGIVLGLVVGKPLGVFGFSLVAAMTRLGRRPTGVSWIELLGAAMLCGAGFTMSLYMSALAFDSTDPFAQSQARMAVLAASLAAVLAGGSLLSWYQANRATAEQDDAA